MEKDEAPNWLWECTNKQCGEAIPGWVDDPQGILFKCGPFRCPTCKCEMKNGPIPVTSSQKKNQKNKSAACQAAQ